MLINYGSTMYCVYLGAVIAACVILYLLIKNRAQWFQKAIVFLISLLNFAQHVFKAQLYPQYQSGYSIHLSSAYNVCAFLVLVSPFIILFGNQLLKNFLTYVGSFAALLAMVVPYWFIGQSAFTWEVYRFYICHALLFLSSILPAFVGLHKLEWKHTWKIGLMYFGTLLLILINDAVLIKLGLYPVENPEALFASLSALNPAWSMHPPAQFAYIWELLAKITPAFLMGGNPWGIYIPILWYAIPMYLGITILTCIICGLFQAFFKYREYLNDSKVPY